jgi:ubiquinol-cytochrome c reductase cytochrome c1 subunit
MSVSRFLFAASIAAFLLSSSAYAVTPTVLGGAPAAEEPAPKGPVVEEAAKDIAADVPAGAESEIAATPGEGSEPESAHGESESGHDAASGHGSQIIAELPWSFDGIFGTYDRGALQRGFQVYKEVCAACHSMNRLAYRNLSDLGYNDAQVKTIAADALITDGPNDEGEMFERPGRPSDRFKSPYANVQQAKYANNGAYPPDLSLIAKARHGGADYIHAILTGYEDPPANKEIMPGQYWNTAMNGNVLAMPPPLNAGQVTYADGSPESVDQYARDVAHFLTWAAEPHMEERKRTGVKVFLFLLVFTGLMYAVKRKLWSDIH